MNQTVLTIALILIGWAGAKLLLRRFPVVTRTQVFCAIAAWVASVGSVAMKRNGPIWYHASLVIAVVMGTFLLLALFRHWETQRQARSV
jgi:hypothetical protein